MTEVGIRKLKAMADEHGLAWEYAPLVRFLREAVEQGEAGEVQQIGVAVSQSMGENGLFGRIGLDVIGEGP